MSERGDKSVTEAVAGALTSFADDWVTTEDKAIQPGDYRYTSEDGRLASVARGHQFFIDSCLSCHKNYGRKDNLQI